MLEEQAVREITKVENEKSVQLKTLEVLTSLQSLLASTGNRSPTKAKTTSPSPRREPSPSSRIYGESRSEFTKRVIGDVTASAYVKDKLTGYIIGALRPLESVLGWNLKLLLGRGIVNLKNIITGTSESERAIKKANTAREKGKLAELKEEMRLDEKYLKLIGIKDIKKSRLRDEEGRFVSDKGMTKYQKLQALTSQYSGEIEEATKSSTQRKVEKILGIKSGNFFRPRSKVEREEMHTPSTKKNYPNMGDLSPSFLPEQEKSFFKTSLKAKFNPTIKDLAITEPGQAVIWYYNQIRPKKGVKEEGGVGDIMGGILGGTVLSGILKWLLPLLPGLISAAIPALIVALLGAGLVALIVDSISNKKKEELKDKKALEKIAVLKMEHPEMTEEELDARFAEMRYQGGKLDQAIPDGAYYDPVAGVTNLYKSGRIVKTEYGDTSKPIKKVKDTIITKTGRIVETSPNDNIYATTNDLQKISPVANGFDNKNLQQLLEKIKVPVNKEENNKELIAAIKEQTEIFKKKTMGNVVSTSFPNMFNFDKVRISMSYGNGGI